MARSMQYALYEDRIILDAIESEVRRDADSPAPRTQFWSLTKTMRVTFEPGDTCTDTAQEPPRNIVSGLATNLGNYVAQVSLGRRSIANRVHSVLEQFVDLGERLGLAERAASLDIGISRSKVRRSP